MSNEYTRAKTLLEQNGIKVGVKPRKSSERYELIYKLHTLGMNVAELGRLYEISSQRVSQILHTFGVDLAETRANKKVENIIKKYEDRIAKLQAKVKHNGEVFKAEHLKVLQLQQQITLRDNKLAKVENFTQQLEEYRYKNLHLSSQLGKAKTKIAELEKELKALKNQKKTIVVKKK